MNLNVFKVKEESRSEAYEYFDKNIRELPKKASGEFDVSPEEFYDNDVDAFRHAYTSGVFVHEYIIEIIADVLGQIQEIRGNNSVGRKYVGSSTYDIDPKKPVVVLKESDTGRNEIFFDLVRGIIMSRDIFVQDIVSGQYPGYEVASINSLETPKSKPDNTINNNLG